MKSVFLTVLPGVLLTFVQNAVNLVLS
jgi:hypothetical protein